MTRSSQYNAAEIEVLEGLEPVRKRPGMYIAGTDTPAGLHQLVYEIVDNSVDEAMNGFADTIDVVLHSDGCSVTVIDNGRGIPVDKHPKFKKSALELILTTLHAGGKFSSKNYQTSGGLHGVGSSVVNALSKEFIATVRRDGKEYQQRFERGIPVTQLRTVSTSVKGTGTTIHFAPDPEVFKSIEFSPKLLKNTLQTKAYLNPGLNISFKDEVNNTKEEYCYADGLKAYLCQLLEERKLECVGAEQFCIRRENHVIVDVAFCWTDQTKEEFRSFANGIHTVDGGSHEDGAKAGLVKAIRNYMNVHGLQPKGIKIGAEDIREGIIGLISVKMPSEHYQAQFQGQTKSRLNNPEIAPLVEGAMKGLEQLLNEKPSVANEIVQRIVCAAKARAASRAAGQNVRRKIGISHRLTLPGKLADCTSTNPQETEVFIVEGDSAGGSAKQGRDRHFQAVLPLRGKVLNTISSPKKGFSDNRELSNIVSALGCGAGDALRADRLRYGKVIILTDADADGMHISTLLMGFFFAHMRGLIEEGCLYIGYPPLYGIFDKGASMSSSKGVKGKPKRVSAGSKSTVGKASGKANSSKGKKVDSGVWWAYSDEEMQSIVKEQKLTNPRIVRYKGLGEMNPETLWETTLDPNVRTLLRVTVDDAQAVLKGLNALMGSDPKTRYELIQSSAHMLELDL